MSNHQRFMALKGGVGDQYICPLTGRPLDNHNGPDMACGLPASNMGRLAYCQVGAGVSYTASDNAKLMYTTTGTIDINHFQCHGEQHGGYVKNKACKCKCGKCRCKGSCNCSFRQHSPANHANGYYFDLEAPKIGNRPVVATHNKGSQNTWKGGPSFLDRIFGCRQPYWTKQCD